MSRNRPSLWPRVDCTASEVGRTCRIAALILLGLALAASAAAQPRIDWVAVVAGKPQAPNELKPGATLAIRIDSAQVGDWTLNLRAFPKGGGASAPRELPSLPPARWKARAKGSLPMLLVPLPGVDWRQAVQLEGWLTDGKGRGIGAPAVLTLDTAAAAAHAPSAMQRALRRGGDLLDRMTRLYEVVRHAGATSRLYSARLDGAGSPLGAPAVHDLPAGKLVQLAASPGGRHAAWALEDASSAGLWIVSDNGPARLLWSGAAPLAGPAFVDDDTLLFAASDGLVVATTSTTPSFKTHALVAGTVSALHFAERRDGIIQAIVTLTATDTTEAQPFLVTLGTDGRAATAVRVPVSPFYRGYGAVTDSGALFFAGPVSGIDGIHVVGPGDAPLRTLYRCTTPRLVAAAARGGQVQFIADTCEP